MFLVITRDFFLLYKDSRPVPCSKGPIFGAWLTEGLARHGYNISPGTLYPTLHRLKEDGYLESTEKAVNGRVRKYYQTIRKGLLVLD